MCDRFDLDKTNSLLAVATGDLSGGGVTVWRIDTFYKIGEIKIGSTFDVRFNATPTKAIAVKKNGEIHELALES